MSGTVLKAPATTGTSIKAAAGEISSPSFNPVQSAHILMVQSYTGPSQRPFVCWQVLFSYDMTGRVAGQEQHLEGNNNAESKLLNVDTEWSGSYLK